MIVQHIKWIYFRVIITQHDLRQSIKIEFTERDREKERGQRWGAETSECDDTGQS